MTQQTAAGQTSLGSASARGDAAAAASVRIAGAMLAIAVAAVHVADQGGITAFAAPDWIGWGYRIIEAGGVLTALALLFPRPARLLPAQRWPDGLGWAAAVLLGAGPFAAYIASRPRSSPASRD
jgi:hypothetical protein